MRQNTFSRRHFFYGTLLAGAVPAGGFGSAPSLPAGLQVAQREAEHRRHRRRRPARRTCGRRSGRRERGRTGRRRLGARRARLQALAQGARSTRISARCSTSRARRSTPWSWARPTTCTPPARWPACSRASTSTARSRSPAPPGKRACWRRRRRSTRSRRRWATRATRTTRRAWPARSSGRARSAKCARCTPGTACPGWPQGMQKIPPPTPVPDTLDWDLWLGGAAKRAFTAGDEEYKAFVARQRSGQAVRQAAAPTLRLLPALQLARLLRFRQRPVRRLGRPHLGPANWALQLTPGEPDQRRGIKKEGAAPSPIRCRNAVKYEFAARGSMPPVTVYWSDSVQGDAYLPPGMTAERRARSPDTGPQVGPRRATAAGPAAATTASSSVPRATSAPAAAAKAWACCRARAGRNTNCRNAYLHAFARRQHRHNHSAHCRDWVRACKGGAPACSNFSIAGPYTEWLVLGAVAAHYEGKLMWDNAKMEFSNNKDATGGSSPPSARAGRSSCNRAPFARRL